MSFSSFKCNILIFISELICKLLIRLRWKFVLIISLQRNYFIVLYFLFQSNLLEYENLIYFVRNLHNNLTFVVIFRNFKYLIVHLSFD